DARVAGVDAVVAEEEVAAGRHAPRPGLVVAEARVDVRIVQSLAVDEDDAAPLRDDVAGKTDEALHEGRAAVVRPALRRRGRRLEDDDLSALRAPEVVREPVDEYAV